MVSASDATGLISGFDWGTTTIYYTFPDAVGDYPADYSPFGELNSFNALSETERDWFRLAFAEFNNVSGLNLTEIAPSSEVQSIRVADSDAPAVAYAYLPTGNTQDGDVWFDMDRILFDGLSGTSPIIGSYAWHTVMHEIGHSLGLKHGHEEEFGQPALDASVDGMEYTIMTYRSYVGDPTAGAYNNSQWGYAQSLMILDIAALQQTYGANFSYASGDNIYTVSPETGDVFRDGVTLGTPGENRVFRTLWDGGGEDTIDLSNYTRAVDLDLSPGGGVDLDVHGDAQAAQLGTGIFAEHQIYFALLHENDPRGLFENAIGGSGDDVITGNNGANVLHGGAGGDVMTGGLGRDVFAGSLADLEGDTITDFSIADTLHVLDNALNPDDAGLFGVGEGSLLSLAPARFLSLSTVGLGASLHWYADGAAEETYITLEQANDVVIGDGDARYISSAPEVQRVAGTEGANLIALAGGADIVDAGAGSDIVSGGNGDDILIGGLGPDILTGGGGADSFIFRLRDAGTAPVIDTVTDFQLDVDVLVFEGFTGDLSFAEISGDAVVGVGDIQYVRLQGVSLDSAPDPIRRDAQTAFDALGTPDALRLNDGDDRYISPSSANEVIDAKAGNDVISTGAGNDDLSGGAGADILSAGAGQDRLTGGTGPDVMTGGADADVFAFDLSAQPTAAEVDRIKDFAIDQDLVELSVASADFDTTLLSFGDDRALALGPSWFVVFEGLEAIESLPDSSILWV